MSSDFSHRLPKCMVMMSYAAKDFQSVQKKVAELIKGKVLVGHALRNDLKVNIANPMYIF